MEYIKLEYVEWLNKMWLLISISMFVIGWTAAWLELIIF